MRHGRASTHPQSHLTSHGRPPSHPQPHSHPIPHGRAPHPPTHPLGVGRAMPRGNHLRQPHGHDETGDGSEARPFYSLRHAANQAAAGGTICVRGGVYTAAQETIIARGTADKPILIRPYPGEQPILDGTGADLDHTDSILLVRHSAHLTIEGLEVRNSSGRGISVYESEYITIQHNRVHHTQTRAIGGGGDHITFAYNHIWEAVLENENNAYDSQGGWAGALASYGREDGSPSTNIVMRGNLIHNVWGEGIIALRAIGFVVEDNTVFDAFSVNIYIDKVRDGRFENNYLYSTTNAYNRSDRPYPANGITIANEGAQPDHPVAEDLLIRNNVIIGTGAGINYWHYPYAPNFAGNTYLNITITHNVIKDTQFTAVAIDEVPSLLYDAPSGIVLANNIIYAGRNGRALTIGNPDAWQISHNVWPDGLPSYGDPAGLVIEPEFVNPQLGGSHAGFQLAPNSLANGRGLVENE